jgi:hypothetical protein
MSRALVAVTVLSSLILMTCANASPPAGRLPDNVRPTAYRLDLIVDPGAARFSGHTEIDAVLAQPATTIFLHGKGLTVTRVGVIAGHKTHSASYSEVDPSGVARLDLPHKIPAGKVTLKFDYSSDFRDTAEGLFRARVGGDWYAWTQLEAIDARRMFPGFDEPGFKTPFTVKVTAPAGARVFANAPEVAIAAEGSSVVHHFAPTKPLPTYLVAIGVGPFDVVETTVPPNAVRKEPLAFRVIATRGQLRRMQYAADEAPKLLRLLEAYFGSPYPYEKLDLLASPVQFGAMENAGLIIFADSLILLDQDAPLRQVRGFAETSAHEMAHQWFGDLVTPTWWTDIWLNESFAEWMGNKIAHQWRSDLGIEAMELSNAFDAMDFDSLSRGRPIRQEITRNTEISSAFDSITYKKGAQVLSMFESYLGADMFAEGVRRHLARHRHGNATADDFFRSLESAAGSTQLVPALRTFTEQTGIPVVAAGTDAHSLSLAQTRYRPLGVAASARQLWTIPICLSRGGSRSCTLMENGSAAIAPLPDLGHALMPNANGAGYYRFSLDGPGWDRLIGASAELPGREAMALADSLWADFAAGGIDFNRVIAGARALSRNPERLAAVGLAYRLKSIADTMLKPEQQPGYRKLMGSIYAPRLTGLGDDVGAGTYAGEPVQRRALRESLLPLVALEARDPALRAKLLAAAMAYLGGDAHALDPSFRALALQVAVQDGDVTFLARLKEAMLKSSDPQFKRDLSIAIGGGDTASLADAALAIATSPGIGSLESMYVFFSLVQHPGARDRTTMFARNNFARLLDLFPSFARPRIVDMFGGYCAIDEAASIETFFRPKLEAMGGGELELAQTKERIGLCASLKSAKGAEIAAALAN